MAENDDTTPANHEATAHADLYHRHGDPDPTKWQEAEAVTGRPNDLPIVESEAALPNSTFGARAKARSASEKRTAAKQVEDAENKAVSASETKTTTKRRSKRG